MRKNRNDDNLATTREKDNRLKPSHNKNKKGRWYERLKVEKYTNLQNVPTRMVHDFEFAKTSWQ